MKSFSLRKLESQVHFELSHKKTFRTSKKQATTLQDQLTLIFSKGFLVYFRNEALLTRRLC